MKVGRRTSQPENAFWSYYYWVKRKKMMGKGHVSQRDEQGTKTGLIAYCGPETYKFYWPERQRQGWGGRQKTDQR